MNIEVQLLGYKGRITHMLSRPSLSPWQREDELLAVIEFDQPYPASVISTAINIPVKDYSKEEFLEVVKKRGEEQLAATIEKHDQVQEKNKADAQRREEIDAIARSIEAKFG